MRTETIENEAKLYDETKACYIHVEKAPTATGYGSIMVGDNAVIAQALYNLCCEFATEKANTTPAKLWKWYRHMYKKVGWQTPKVIGGETDG